MRRSSPAAVATASDIVMLCVLDGAAVEEVCFGPGGVAAARGGAATLVDFSTIPPELTVDLAGRLKAVTDADWIEAHTLGFDELRPRHHGGQLRRLRGENQPLHS